MVYMIMIIMIMMGKQHKRMNTGNNQIQRAHILETS